MDCSGEGALQVWLRKMLDQLYEGETLISFKREKRPCSAQYLGTEETRPHLMICGVKSCLLQLLLGVGGYEGWLVVAVRSAGE